MSAVVTARSKEEIEAATASAEDLLVPTVEDSTQTRLPVRINKLSDKTMNSENHAPNMPTTVASLLRPNEDVSGLRVRFVDTPPVERGAKRNTSNEDATVPSPRTSCMEPKSHMLVDRSSAQTSANPSPAAKSTCDLYRRQTDAVKPTRSANGITLRRTSSNGSVKATVEIWEPWKRSSIAQLGVASSSKIPISRHQDVPCIETKPKSPSKEDQHMFDATTVRPRVADAPQTAASPSQPEDAKAAKSDGKAASTSLSKQSLSQTRQDSMGAVETPVELEAAPKSKTLKGKGNFLHRSSPEQLFHPSPFEVVNTSENISCIDWIKNKGSSAANPELAQHDEISPSDIRSRRELSQPELQALVDHGVVSTPIEPDPDFTAQRCLKKERKQTSTTEQLEQLRHLWKEDRRRRKFAGGLRSRARNVLSRFTRLMPGNKVQARSAALYPSSSTSSASSLDRVNIAHALTTLDYDADVDEPGRLPAELEASEMRTFHHPHHRRGVDRQTDQKHIESDLTSDEHSPSKNGAFELSAESEKPNPAPGTSQPITWTTPVSPTAVLFAPTASPLPPMPPQPRLTPQEDRSSGRQLGTSSMYHRVGPFICNEGSMRSLADFSLSEVQRYWLRARADAHADVLEGWTPLGL